MKRTAPLKRNSGVRKQNPARRKREWVRAYHSKERVAFVRGLRCAVRECRNFPSENAHCATGGVARKADAKTILPLCFWHHIDLHQMGQATFQTTFGIDLKEEAAKCESDWQEFKSQLQRTA